MTHTYSFFCRFLHPKIQALGVSSGLLTGIALAQGCDPGSVAEQCGLDIHCEAGGFVEGNASISGVASIDAFFGTAIDLDASLRGLALDIRAELDAIAASVGLDRGATGAQIAAAIDLHLSGYVQGGLTIDIQPPRCSASVDVVAAAAAQCDAELDPGSISVRCSGSCAAEAGASVDCGAEATLVCTGTAPALQCDGTCTGSCAVEIAGSASCEGTCRGSCSVDGSTMNGFDGRCAGSCEGECVVEMSAGAHCEGSCEGSCTWEAPEGMCDASASARCEAAAGASIECDAGCEGSAEPPSVSAECEATVEAKASASVQCMPPAIDIGFGWNAAASADPKLQAEFRAWLTGFRLRLAAIAALRARAELVVEATQKLVAAGTTVLPSAFGELAADANLKIAIGARCALEEVPVAVAALTASSGDASAELAAAAEVMASS